MTKQLWMDEGGATISAELALVGTILVIGVIVGLSAVQDAVNTELADLGQAIGNIDQSYSHGGTTGHHAAVSGFNFTDAADACDDVDSGDGTGTRCLALCVDSPIGTDNGAGSGGSGSGPS